VNLKFQAAAQQILVCKKKAADILAKEKAKYRGMFAKLAKLDTEPPKKEETDESMESLDEPQPTTSGITADA